VTAIIRACPLVILILPLLAAAPPATRDGLTQVDSGSRVGTATSAVTLLLSSQAVHDTSRTGQSVVTGYVQKVQVERRPRVVQVAVPFDDSGRTRTERRTEELSPALLGCGADVVVEVIANEITLGQNGPNVPTRVDWKLGAGAWQPAFADADVTVGMEETWDLSAGGELLVRGKMAYPSFDSFFISREIVNDDANFVLILVDNDDPLVKLALKGVQPPYGAQASIPSILAPYLDGEGKINLPTNEMIAMYELGSTDISEPSADYQDLVLKIRTGCPIGSEVVLRDSIGTDNSWTNGNFPFISNQNPGFFWQSSAGFVSANESLILKDISVIFGRMSTTDNFSQLDYVIRVWSSLSSAETNPNLGNVANIIFTAPTQGPTPWGQTGDQPPAGVIGVQPTWKLAFDISSSNIQMLTGQTYLIAVQIQTGGATQGGIWGIMESSELGNTDLWCDDSAPCTLWVNIADDPYSLWNGRLALKVSGQTF